MGLAAELPRDRARVVHEPTPGIAAARNRALDEAGGADALVFIDDDERPDPGWLDALIATWTATGAAAVVGPVRSTFTGPLDPWIEAGEFFRRRRLATGTPIDVFATNNVLLDLRQVRASGVRFDVRFGETGGSDTLFSRELSRAGARMVWCADAGVVDVVPAERLTRQWVLRRALRSGNALSRTSLAVEPSAAARTALRLRLSAEGLARIVAGCATILLGTVARSLRHRAGGARTLARGLGITAGAWGYTYAEYRRVRRAG
jgi:hypothetical protein